jgi:hypothetical protein
VPFSALGIVLALLLREVPLRMTTGRGAGMAAAESQAMNESAENAELGAESEGLMPEGSPATTR